MYSHSHRSVTPSHATSDGVFKTSFMKLLMLTWQSVCISLWWWNGVVMSVSAMGHASGSAEGHSFIVGEVSFVRRLSVVMFSPVIGSAYGVGSTPAVFECKSGTSLPPHRCPLTLTVAHPHDFP